MILDDGLVKGAAKEGKLGDLTEGTGVALRVSAFDKKTVLGIRLQGRSLTGNVKGVDTGINTGGYALYVRDPDGITVELFQPPAGRT